MKQTAVEWLYEQILLTPLDIRSINKCLEQAKEMEKEQIIYFYSYGWHDGQDVIIQQVKHIDKGGDELGELLYNETYKR